MKTEEANEQCVYLFATIDKASNAVDLFKKLRSKEFTTGVTKEDNLLEEILLSFVILKIHTVFDKSKRNVCLEGFLKTGMKDIVDSEADKQNIAKKFEDIKRKYQLIIKQVENNRHEEVVHIPKEPKLGVIEEVAIEIRKLGHSFGNKEYINQKSVLHEKMRFSVGNFPIKEVKKLINDLSLLVWNIRYQKLDISTDRDV